MAKELIVTTDTPDGQLLFLARRQNLDNHLLADSVTRNAAYAYRWLDSPDASYNRQDAERFAAHAEQYAPLGWAIKEA